MRIQKSEKKSCDILVIARLSPRRSSRTRRLIRALSPNFKVQAVSERPDGASEKDSDLDGVRLDEIALPFPGFHLWYFTGGLRVFYFNILTFLIAINSNASAVVCSDSLYCLPGIMFKIFLHRKFVYNSHEIMWALGTPPLLSHFMGWLEKLAIQFCDFWMVPSEERAAIILNKHGLDKPYLVYENFPIVNNRAMNRTPALNKISSGRKPQDKPIVMFQGFVTQGRGVEELIRSAQSGKFLLIIQGTGELLHEICKTENENVIFLDACSNTDTIRWLKMADLSFVYYENKSLNYAYACSNKFYASVFAGIPIICNRLPAFQTFAEKYGGVVFFETLAPRAIEASIAKALNPSHYKELKREIQLAQSRLTSIPLELKINQAFSELLGGGRW